MQGLYKMGYLSCRPARGLSAAAGLQLICSISEGYIYLVSMLDSVSFLLAVYSPALREYTSARCHVERAEPILNGRLSHLSWGVGELGGITLHRFSKFTTARAIFES